jgi:hydrogenase maturation protease
MSRAAKTLIVGLGSAHGDDQAGWLVAEMLMGLCGEFEDVTVCRALVPLDVLDWLDGIDVLHLCDACEPTSWDRQCLKFRWEAGQLVRWDSPTELLVHIAAAPFRGRGSHDFSVPEMLQLAEQIGSLPEDVVLWAITGVQFQPGDAMSEQTRRTAVQAAEEILKVVAVRE